MPFEVHIKNFRQKTIATGSAITLCEIYDFISPLIKDKTALVIKQVGQGIPSISLITQVMPKHIRTAYAISTKRITKYSFLITSD